MWFDSTHHKRNRVLSKTVVLPAIILAVFLVAALFGAAISFSKDEHGHMVSCPWMRGHAMWCPMSAVGHMASWQQAFLATIPLLVLAFIALNICLNRRDVELIRGLLPFSRIRHRATSFAPVLVEEFSNGILHPKLFA